MTNRKTLEYCQRALAKQEKVDFNKVGIIGVRDFFEAKVHYIKLLLIKSNRICNIIKYFFLFFFQAKYFK